MPTTGPNLPGPDRRRLLRARRDPVHLSQRPGQDPRRPAPGAPGLDHPRRHRLPGRRRFPVPHRPQGVHHHLRRRQHLPSGDPRTCCATLHPGPALRRRRHRRPRPGNRPVRWPRRRARRVPNETELEQEIIAFVKSKIASSKAPKTVRFVRELPRSEGKLMKSQLKAESRVAETQCRDSGPVTAEIRDVAALDLARHIRPGAGGLGPGLRRAEPAQRGAGRPAQANRRRPAASPGCRPRPRRARRLATTWSARGRGGQRQPRAEPGGPARDRAQPLLPAAPGILTSNPSGRRAVPGAAAAGSDGRFGLGLGADYLAPLVGRVAMVIAEVNDQVPDVGLQPQAERGEIDVLVYT